MQSAAGVTPEQVIAVTPLTATAIVSPKPASGAGGEVTLRAQALSQAAAARAGVLTWQVKLSVDCQRRLVRPGATTGYADRQGAGDGVQLAPAETVWRSPTPGTILESALLALCDPGFQPPLSGVRVAQAAPSPAPPLRPPPAPRPARPAVAEVTTNAVAQAPVATAPARKGDGAAQVVSSPSAEDSRDRLAQLRRRFGPAFAGLDTRVQSAAVRGRTVYRGLVVGFASRAQAQAFCATLKAGRQDCLAR